MNTETEDRLAKLEQRMATMEAVIEKAEGMFEAFAKGPGKKLLAMFGAQLP